MLLSDYLAERNLTIEDAAALLAEKDVRIVKGPNAGTPVTIDHVKKRINNEISKPWAEAFGVDQEPGGTSPADGTAPGAPSRSGGRRESAPKRPADAPIQVGPGAQKRIAGAYKFAGAMLATGSGREGVAVVFGDCSEEIAKLWIEAAEESPWAARFVNMMQAGGVTGDLAAAHLYLAGATLYVLGANIPLGHSAFAKYSKYRPVGIPVAEPVRVEPEPSEPEPAAEDFGANGAAAGAVAHSPV